MQKVEKCKQYWPSMVGHTLKFNRTNMMVTLVETKQFADYQINTLILKKVRWQASLRYSQCACTLPVPCNNIKPQNALIQTKG